MGIINNKKTLFILILILLSAGLVFFVSYKINQYKVINQKIINFLKEDKIEQAVNLGGKIDNFEKYISFLPLIQDQIQLRRNIRDIQNNLKKIKNGFFLSDMLQKKKTALSILFEIQKDLNYFDKYNISFIENQKQYLENWLSFLGKNQTRNYLILFQEPAIPRPTGGFIGAYAILTFDNGKIDLSGDTIFSLDEIFLKKVIPPYPLQFISDRWLFHDANWFFDFPTSSQKILEFYSYTEMSPLLDGIIIVNPSVLELILEKIGPINIKEYNLVIDQSNFYSFFKTQIQEGAKPATRRYGDEIFSLFIKQLQKKASKTPPEICAQIPNILRNAFIKKDIQIYVMDDNLEYFFDSLKWTGKVEESKGDYLAVVFNLLNQNFYEDTRQKVIKLKTEFVSDGQMIDTLIIEAPPRHSLDKAQESYLKIYLPKGIIIKKAENGYLKNHKNISLDYKKLGYEEDDDLHSIEKTKIKSEDLGIEIYEEGGKTVIGTWTKLSAKPFKLVYKLPFNWFDFPSWELKVQKQSGQNIEFSYEPLIPENIEIIPTLFPFNKLISLEQDFTLTIKRM